MNLSYAEFWKNVSTKKGFREFGEQLERSPLIGIGAKGGGRVMICENCGKVKYITNHSQNFCSRKCHYNYYHTDSKVNVLPKGEKPKKKHAVHRICGYCGKEFKVQISRIRSGNGIYCSAECSNKAKGLKPIWFTCNKCKMEFRAVSDATCRHCSIECAADMPTFDEYGTYIESRPTFVDGYDLIDHKINMILKSIQHEHPEVHLTIQLRVEILTRKDKEKVDDYYLTTKQREQLALLKRLISDDPRDYID